MVHRTESGSAWVTNLGGMAGIAVRASVPEDELTAVLPAGSVTKVAFCNTLCCSTLDMLNGRPPLAAGVLLGGA